MASVKAGGWRGGGKARVSGRGCVRGMESQERYGTWGAWTLPVHGGRNREKSSGDPVGPHPQWPTKPPSHRNGKTQVTGVGRCPSAGRRCQALVSMALPQGPADGSLPMGDPSPADGTSGPSQALASPAATRRRALLRELEARVQAAYGQVNGTGAWGHPQLRGW